MSATSEISRDFTVATFVVADDRVLLLFHRKLRMWLPPGGHIDPPELPDEAAVREVFEETGIRARLLGERALPLDYPPQLIRPEGIQLENISPGHQHIDLVYFAVPAETAEQAIVPSPECDNANWYGLSELESMGVNDEIRMWSERAIIAVRERLATLRGSERRVAQSLDKAAGGSV